MTEPTTPELLPVTQADREAVNAYHNAAARYMFEVLKNPTAAQMLGDVQDDSHPIYQAFARHRIEATRLNTPPGMDGVAEQTIAALERCQRVLSDLINPPKGSSVLNAYAQCVEAERAASKALAAVDRVERPQPDISENRAAPWGVVVSQNGSVAIGWARHDGSLEDVYYYIDCDGYSESAKRKHADRAHMVVDAVNAYHGHGSGGKRSVENGRHPTTVSTR